jgi:hypothetical protein
MMGFGYLTVALALFVAFANVSHKNLLMVDICDNYTALPARLATLLATVDDAYLYFCDFYLPVFSSLYLLTLSEYETALLSHFGGYRVHTTTEICKSHQLPLPSPPLAKATVYTQARTKN